jgi:hypothetical protein
MKTSFNNLLFISLLVTLFSVNSCEIHYECSCFESGGIASEITNNHGHELNIPAADFSDPVDGTYSIKGSADHDHQVSFTGEDLEIVSGYNSKTVTSTSGGTDGHTHEVTLDCGCK